MIPGWRIDRIFFVYGKGVQRDLHGGKRINFFSNKGRNGRYGKPDVIRYSVVIAFDARVSVPFAKGGKERHFRRFGKKYDLPEASIVKSFKTITQKFHFMYHQENCIKFEIILRNILLETSHAEKKLFINLYNSSFSSFPLRCKKI